MPENSKPAEISPERSKQLFVEWTEKVILVVLGLLLVMITILWFAVESLQAQTNTNHNAGLSNREVLCQFFVDQEPNEPFPHGCLEVQDRLILKGSTVAR